MSLTDSALLRNNLCLGASQPEDDSPFEDADQAWYARIWLAEHEQDGRVLSDGSSAEIVLFL